MSEIPKPHDQQPQTKLPDTSIQSLIEQNPSNEQQAYLELIFQLLPINMAATDVILVGVDPQQSYPFSFEFEEPVFDQDVPPETLVRLTDESKAALLSPFNRLRAYLLAELETTNTFLETFPRKMLKGKTGNRLERLLYRTMHGLIRSIVTDDEYTVFVEPNLIPKLRKRPEELKAELRRNTLSTAVNSLKTFADNIHEPMTLQNISVNSTQCLITLGQVIPLNPPFSTIINDYLRRNAQTFYAQNTKI